MNARRVRNGLLVAAMSAAALWLTTSAQGATPGVNSARARIITGAGPGGGPDVRTFSTDGSLKSEFFAYDAGFHGGVRVATGHLNCDGSSQVITAPGSGGGPNVKAFNQDGTPYVGINRTAPTSFFAYDGSMTSGVTLAVGDLDGNGCDEIITGTGVGAAPVVRVFNNDGSNAQLDFTAYDPNFKGGVWVATGDVDGDGRDEIITGAGPGGGPHVKVWKYGNGAITQVGGGFFAYDPGFVGGVRVATATLGNNNNAEIITAPGSGGGPNVKGFDVKVSGTGASFNYTFTPDQSFMAYDAGFAGGVFVGGDGNHTKSVNIGPATNTNVDALNMYATGPGAGGGPHINAYRGSGTNPTNDFFAYDKGFVGGVMVAMGDFGPASTTTTTQPPRSTTTGGPTSSTASTPSTASTASTSTTMHTTTSAPATTSTTCNPPSSC
ncbi:MAG: VCBS repeat-containing protein [Actinobacteria bacterium]|nr:VCBS repeat-containing protein [Actinomycetota bacterium]